MKLKDAERIEDKAIKAVVKKIEKGVAKEEGGISKGAGIRELFAGGLSVKEISETTGIRYTHCYNVVNNEVMKHGLQVEKGERGGGEKKAKIIELLKEGKTLSEVSRELGVLYNYVWQVRKSAGLQPEKPAEAKEEK